MGNRTIEFVVFAVVNGEGVLVKPFVRKDLAERYVRMRTIPLQVITIPVHHRLELSAAPNLKVVPRG